MALPVSSEQEGMMDVSTFEGPQRVEQSHPCGHAEQERREGDTTGLTRNSGELEYEGNMFATSL